ncbi:MAG: hypothetical protein KIT45_06675 [Fimbriimonadia bacterium]|nr:hypothetical protein [Fimbriimonadia bacterium]
MPNVCIIVDSARDRASVVQRMLQMSGLQSVILNLVDIPEGTDGKSVINTYDAAIFLQHETNQNSSGNKRFYTWVAYAPGDKPLAHFGCVNRLAGSSSADYNITLGALSPAFPVRRFNTADIPGTSYPYSACTFIAPGSSTFTLTFGGQTTASLAFNETAANIQTEIEGLSSVGAGQVSVRPIAGLTRTYDIVFANPAITSLLTASAGAVTAIETSGYRARLAGTRVQLHDGKYLWCRAFSWRNGTNFGAMRVNPANLDSDREVLLRPVIDGVTVPSEAALGVRYFNRYFLPCTGTASNAAICRPQHETSYDWLQSAGLHWVWYFLGLAGVSPSFRLAVAMEHDHPIDDNTAVFAGTLAEQRERRRVTELASYEWLRGWCSEHGMPVQLGVNTGGRSRPRYVSSDAKTHWQAMYDDDANNTQTARDAAVALNTLLSDNMSNLPCNAHDHTREMGFYYGDYPRHTGGNYGIGNAFGGAYNVLACNDAQPILYPSRYVVTITATGGTWTLAYAGSESTSALDYNATASTVESALQSLSTVGVGAAHVASAGSGVYHILLRTPAAQGALTLSGASLTGGSGTLSSWLSVDNPEILRLHLEDNLMEMQALGFANLHGNTGHCNNARNAKAGNSGYRVWLEYGVQSLRIADSALESSRIKQIGFGQSWRLLRMQEGVELFATSSASLDVGNKGLLTDGGTSGNDLNANDTWSLLVGVATPATPTASELTIARNRLMSIVGDRIAMMWLMGYIPYLHGSNAHAADPADPTAPFAGDQNWNAMIEIHTAAGEYLDAFADWLEPTGSAGMRRYRNRLRNWLQEQGAILA